VAQAPAAVSSGETGITSAPVGNVPELDEQRSDLVVRLGEQVRARANAQRLSPGGNW
jgi:hypothetical protein